MEQGPHIVVVEDETAQRQLLVDYLARQNFRVSGVDGGIALRKLLQRELPALVLLDVGLPGEDGFALARWLREKSGRIGIVMVTAATDAVDRVAGLETGADDYIAKPFDPRELLARVKSVLRRAGGAAVATAGSRVRMGRRVLDLQKRALVDPSDGSEEMLTASEFDLLKVFAEHPNRPLQRDWLLEVTAHREMEAFDRAIDLRITRLRRKIEFDPGHPDAIRTVRGVGYMFVPPRMVIDPNPREAASQPKAAALDAPDKPSIAVLPFQNMNCDPEQEYFTDGIVEDIITALSRMRWLFVIARNSSFAYKGKSPDIREVARELGVRYVLEGSVRKAANRLRITGQLIDTATGAHLWTDRFDGGLEDVFDLQDQVTSSVVGAIAPKLEQAEIERAKCKPTESLDAYDYYLRGMASIYRWTREDTNEALRHFSKAIELDPDFASAYGMAAWCYFWRMGNGWTTDRMQEVSEVIRLAGKARELGKDDAVALSFGGLALGLVAGEVEAGAALVDRALMLNPNLAAAWIAGGFLKAFLGDHDAAIEHEARAMRLSPLDPLMFYMHHVTAFALYLAGRYDEAGRMAERVLRERPNWLNSLRLAAASNARAGRVEEARRFVARALQLDPEMRISNIRDRFGPFGPQDATNYIEALRKAGLPE